MNIYESIAAIMDELPAIGKGKRNKEQGFMYRGIDDVMNALQPLLSKHKVFVVPEVLEQTREERAAKSGRNLLYSLLKIRYTFYAEDGTSVSAVVIGEGMDTADKASNKALAVGMKYALFQVFCIPTEEMVDPDSETPEDSKPMPAPPAIPAHVCQRCRKPVIAMKCNGQLYSVEQVVENAKASFGVELCWSCMKELRAEQAGEGHEDAG